MTTDLLAACGASLAASSTTTAEVSAFYIASARIAFEQARERLRELEVVLVERERALAAQHRPRRQLALEERGADE